jgi:hypothetical protein
MIITQDRVSGKRYTVSALEDPVAYFFAQSVTKRWTKLGEQNIAPAFTAKSMIIRNFF